MRVTGHLMFNAIHVPCNGGKRVQGHPARPSVWEIHPVYRIDVCKVSTIAACPADDDDKWTPRHKAIED